MKCVDVPQGSFTAYQVDGHDPRNKNTRYDRDLNRFQHIWALPV